MNKSNEKRHNFYRDLLYKALLFVGTVAIIVYFLPRDGKFNYQFDINKPWKYGQLIATFDFPIYKTEDVVKHEQDSILAQFQPYYQEDKHVEDEALKKLKNDYQNHTLLTQLNSNYLQYIEKKLKEVYQAGILSSEDMETLQKDSTRSIMTVSDKLARQQSTDRLFTVKSAYHYILTADTLRYSPRILRQCALNDYLNINLTFDDQRTESARKEMLENYSWANGIVLSGQKIIDRGEIVDSYTYRVLNSFERETQRRSASVSAVPSTIAGQILFVGTLILLFTTYLRLFRKDYFEKPRSIIMLYTMVTVFPVLVSLMISHNVLSVYILPFAIAPIFIRVFLDSRTAFTAHVTMVLICAAAVKYQYEFIIVQLVAGLIAIYSLRELSQRAEIFKTALLVTVGCSAIYFALQLMQDNSITTMDHSMYKYFVANGVLLLFAYPLMLVVEKTFGFTSNVTLIELSNTNKKLLRNLSEVAPGTFQHSVMVSNLAAEIANKIGAKAQLVRTGAMYHDIGKMKNPAFFTENQMGGANPLDSMTRIDAAQVVISHVTEGLKMAEKFNLPGVIKDFIKTHHGSGKTKYFYISYKNEHPDEPVDDTLFTYPGPDPFTREQAILMMADTVEAAARSLKEYTEESISTLVNRLIDGQVDDGYFKTCPITFHDIAVAKQVLTDRLKAIYHTRTSYPELKKEDKSEE